MGWTIGATSVTSLTSFETAGELMSIGVALVTTLWLGDHESRPYEFASNFEP